MVGIELPGEDRLPIGPVRNLVEALHGVYRGAGRPGLRRIAKAITEGDFRDTVSHEAVSDMLNGKSVPRWSKLECVVRQLAVWNSPRLDPDSTAARFLRLWEAATGTTAGVLSQTAFSPNPAGVHGSPAVGQPGAASDCRRASRRYCWREQSRTPGRRARGRAHPAACHHAGIETHDWAGTHRPLAAIL